jgi:predicted Zn-dependent peptidase
MMRRLAALLLALSVAGIAAAQSVDLPEPARVVLDNGVVLILNEKRDVPLIGIEAVLRAGSIADPADKPGVASLFAALLEKGAGERSAAEFAETVDAVGGRLSASADLEVLRISGDFLARDAALAFELLADMILRPTLDREELQKQQELTINRIRSAKDADPNVLMPIYGAGFLFGEHAYSRPVSGDETSLASIEIGDIQAFYEERIGADRLIISVSGDFDSSVVEASLTEAFGEWRPATAAELSVDAPPASAGGGVLLIDKPGATQSYFWLAGPGVARDFARRADLNLSSTLFGGRFTSMLNQALRIDSGLTYGARSGFRQYTAGGSFEISSYTSTATTIEAIDMALAVLARLHEEGINEEMLVSGRNYVLGQYPTNFETAAQLARLFADLEARGLERSYLTEYGTALTAASVESVAQLVADVYPLGEQLVFVVLGDAETIRESLTKYGPVTELSITEPRFRP